MSVAAPAAAQSDPNAVDELVVTGQRLSQQRAIETKREAVGVIDAISADDIGRLAQRTVVPSVAAWVHAGRLPGLRRH